MAEIPHAFGLSAIHKLKSRSTEAYIVWKYGGEGGIRTHETVTRLHGFQPCSFGRSDTSP